MSANAQEMQMKMNLKLGCRGQMALLLVQLVLRFSLCYWFTLKYSSSSMMNLVSFIETCLELTKKISSSLSPGFPAEQDQFARRKKHATGCNKVTRLPSFLRLQLRAGSRWLIVIFLVTYMTNMNYRAIHDPIHAANDTQTFASLIFMATMWLYKRSHSAL